MSAEGGPRALVLGAAAATAFGDLDATWAAVSRGESALGAVGTFDASGFGDPRVARLAEEADADADDPLERILGFHGRVLGRSARRAHEEAGAGELPREDVAFFVSAGVADTTVEDLAPAVLASRNGSGGLDLGRFFESGFRSIHPLWPLTMLNNVGVGQVATELGIRGENTVFGTEADSGVHAFEEALAVLADGAALAALVAGVSDRVLPTSLGRHALRGALSRAPLGEGSGALLLATPESAARAGRRPLGAVLGAASAWEPDAAGEGPSASAVDEAVARAMHDARVRPERVRVVVGDPLVRDGRFPAASRMDPVSRIGHLLAAKPAVDAVLALRAAAAVGPRAVAVVLAGSSTGGAGALVLEAA